MNNRISWQKNTGINFGKYTPNMLHNFRKKLYNSHIEAVYQMSLLLGELTGNKILLNIDQGLQLLVLFLQLNHIERKLLDLLQQEGIHFAEVIAPGDDLIG